MFDFFSKNHFFSFLACYYRAQNKSLFPKLENDCLYLKYSMGLVMV